MTGVVMDEMQGRINKVVAEFSSGRAAAASRLYESLLFEKEGGAPEEFEFCGTLIPDQCLEYSAESCDLLEAFVTDARLTELSNGAEPTKDEKGEYRRRVIAQVEDGSADADVIPGYWVRRLRHSDGRDVFALETVKGYSFSGVTNTFHGLFRNVEEALKELSNWGIVVKG